MSQLGVNSRLARSRQNSLHQARTLLKTNRLRLVKHQLQARSQAAIASLLVAIVLLLDAMAACPPLHELIHHDAGRPDHECAVTMFAHGKVDSAAVEVPVVAPQRFAVVLPPVAFSVFSPAIENLPAGRGPPASRLAS